MEKPVEGYEGLYSVTSDGAVFSHRTGKFLKGSPIPGGYLTVALHKDGVQHTKTIHRLVAAAFCERPAGCSSVNHINSCRTDNRAENLEWCTPRENTHHAMARDRLGRPEKLTFAQAQEIRWRYGGGQGTMAIAREFGVDKATIRKIYRHETYKVARG